jgi:hypothetical protein
MTLTAQIRASVDARRTTQSGLATGVEVKPISIGVDAGDCDFVYAERRTFGEIGYDEINFSTGGLSVVKLLFVKNLSETSAIGLSAGWNGTQFSIFRQDVTSWNFSPMVNLGSLTLRGFPIRPSGDRSSGLAACLPNGTSSTRWGRERWHSRHRSACRYWPTRPRRRTCPRRCG